MEKTTQSSKLTWRLGAVVGGLMLMASLFTALGFGLAYQFVLNGAQPSHEQPILLKAEAASRSKGLSFATGTLGRDIEGLFVLDHLTGTLQCWILNPNTGQIGGIFQANVATDLGTTKAADADYVIVTGRVDVTGRGRGNNMRPGSSICYVGDGNTGKVVAYGLQYDPQSLLRGDEVQNGQLQVVAAGVARDQVERDQ